MIKQRYCDIQRETRGKSRAPFKRSHEFRVAKSIRNLMVSIFSVPAPEQSLLHRIEALGSALLEIVAWASIG